MPQTYAYDECATTAASSPSSSAAQHRWRHQRPRNHSSDQPRAGSATLKTSRIPRPGSQGVAKAAFSPAGSHLTYLKSDDGSLTTQLCLLDVATGTTKLAFGSETSEDSFTLSKEEQMRRERARVMAAGVTACAWAKNADVLLVPADGALFVKQGVDGSAKIRSSMWTRFPTSARALP